jgi:hypothetical protein
VTGPCHHNPRLIRGSPERPGSAATRHHRGLPLIELDGCDLGGMRWPIRMRHTHEVRLLGDRSDAGGDSWTLAHNL